MSLSRKRRAKMLMLWKSPSTQMASSLMTASSMTTVTRKTRSSWKNWTKATSLQNSGRNTLRENCQLVLVIRLNKNMNLLHHLPMLSSQAREFPYQSQRNKPSCITPWIIPTRNFISSSYWATLSNKMLSI